MKKFRLILFIAVCFFYKTNAQTNLLVNYPDTINVTTMDALLDNKFRDTLTKYIYIPQSNRALYKQFRRVFTKAVADSLNTGSYSANLNLLKFYNLIYSDAFLNKQQLLVRIRAEHEIAVGNLTDSICVGWAYDGGLRNGFTVVGKLSLKDSPTAKVFLLKVNGVEAYKVDLKSIVRATADDKKSFYK